MESRLKLVLTLFGTRTLLKHPVFQPTESAGESAKFRATWHLRKALGEDFRQLAAKKEAKVEEGHLLSDHVHMLLSIPPKYSVSSVVGYSGVTRGSENPSG
jgi:Transposase IS200 like